MRTTIRYIVLTALRDRLFLGLFLGILAITGLSMLLGGTSLVENTQMSIVFAAAANRLLLVLGLIVFTCFHLHHAFDAKEIDLLLSRPISRSRVVLAYWCGFALVAVILALPVLAAVSFPGVLHAQGFAVWSITLLLELLMVVAVALFTGFVLKSAVSAVITCLGFYMLARMAELFVMTSESTLLFREKGFNVVLEYSMKAVSSVMPRLDFFGKSEWLVYGPGQEGSALELCLIQAAIYVPLLLLATVVDFRRREF